jgi:cystathionine beta-lyase
LIRPEKIETRIEEEFSMKYNFDEIIDRTGSNSIKHDFITEFGKPAEALPLWVADMDFKVAPEITEALSKAMEHGIYGYSDSKQEYYQAVQNWFKVGMDCKDAWGCVRDCNRSPHSNEGR